MQRTLLLLQIGVAALKAGDHAATETSYSKGYKHCTALTHSLDDTEGVHAEYLEGCLHLALDRLTNAWVLNNKVNIRKLLLISREVSV